MFAVSISGLAIAGSLDSPGAPSAGSGMYTLQNLYDYLTSGTALTVQSSFQEPASGPGSTMKTTKEIGDAIKALLDQSTVTADEVKAGERFFCTQPGSWGVQTGTGLMQPTPTPTITPDPWYVQYGPNGTGDVVQIGTMYVASKRYGTGCYLGGYMPNSSAITWASGLNWLGQTGWRIPSPTEMDLICAHKGELHSYGATDQDPPDTNGYVTNSGIDIVMFATCAHKNEQYSSLVRAVKTK